MCSRVTAKSQPKAEKKIKALVKVNLKLNIKITASQHGRPPSSWMKTSMS